MVIFMQKGANRLQAEAVVHRLKTLGFDSYIRNDGKSFAVAAPGGGANEVNSLALEGCGLKKIERDNAFFEAHRSEFLEADLYFCDEEVSLAK